MAIVIEFWLMIGRSFFSNGLRHCSSFPTVPNYYSSRVRPYLQMVKLRPDVYQSSHLTTNIQGGSHRAYGGLIFAQAIAAAERTVAASGISPVYPQATHAFFIRNVNTKLPIEYHIRRDADGESTFTRSVEAIQNDELVFTAQLCFIKEEPHTIRNQVPMPQVTPWNQIPRLKHCLPDMKKLIAHDSNGPATRGFAQWVDQYVSSNELFDVRVVQSDPAEPHHHWYWFRAAGELPDCDRTHRFLFAYITDSVMSMSAIRPHLLANSFAPSMMFSLDNSTWFHEPDCRADKWFLIEVETPVAGFSRTFASARVFSEDGSYLLSTTQDILIRTKGRTSEI